MMKKTIFYIVTTLTVLIFMMAFYIMVFGAIAISNNRLLNIFGYSYSVVPTESMVGNLEDSIAQGDIIIIKREAYQTLTEGQIIVFLSEEYQIHIAHRIISIDETNGITTKGDANPSIDEELVLESMYVGVVISSFNVLNIGLLGINYRNIIFLVLIIVILIILFREVFSIMKTLKKSQHDQYQIKLENEKKAFIEAEKDKLRDEIKKDAEKELSKIDKET